MTLLDVVDIRECEVQCSDDCWTVTIIMSGVPAYKGALDPPADIDFLDHAASMGVMPDDPEEFVKQLRRGLNALKAASKAH